MDPDQLRASDTRTTDEPSRRRRIARTDRRIGELGAHINAAMAQMMGEIADFETLDGWHEAGAKTPEEWVAWRLGVAPSDARHHVRIARKLRELPLIAASFRRGELSYWQVRAMVPVATPEIEAALLNIARYSTVGQLQRLARAYKGCLDRAELELANQRHRLRSLAYHFDDDGFLIVYGRLDADQGAILVAALEAAEESLRAETTDDPAEPITPEQRRADALVEVARAALAVPEGSTMARPSAVIHVDVRSLIDGSGERCNIADGPSVASETARRLMCDCTIETLFEGDSEVRDVGRRRRTVPPRMRRALEERDVTCVFPGCDRKRYTEGHHIVFWGHGQEGKTKLTNLALLCFHHHRALHEGGYTMKASPDMTFTFFKPDGSVLPRRPDLGDGDPRQLVERSKREQLTIDEQTCTTLWDGKPIDWDSCVNALLTEGGMLAVPRRGP